MNTQKEGGAEWLAVVEFGGIEYVVDIEQRQFRQLYDPDAGVGFHSEEGRQMVKAMLGTEWRAFTPRAVWEKKG